ncbi:citrate synthase [Georgenia muralis]|uniref:citrate synthase (unknown stereospecificity) n=2 Tax=Georgenia muralis TaxID=154117 RepID=A0A3N4Z0S3_9MICO|nr:citrate synthase [Georgenia muralis]
MVRVMPLTPPRLPLPDPGTAPPLYAYADGEPLYRGRRMRDLVGTPFEEIWGLLVDGEGGDALPPAEPFNLPVRTGDTRVDVLSALAQLTPVWGYRPLVEIDSTRAREDLARASVMTLSFVAQSARGEDVPAVPQREVDMVTTIAERFLVRWRGVADPEAVAALDLFWLAVSETGLVPSTRTARTAAEMGADAASCLAAAVAVAGAPFGGGAAARALAIVAEAERTGDADAAIAAHLARGGDLAGFGDELVPADARVGMLRDACVRAGARRLESAEAVARAGAETLARAGAETLARAGAETLARTSGPTPGANTLFWGGVLLDHVGVPPQLFCALYLCGRTAGWSAHVLEVQRLRHL